jgi:hypothetical protein
MVVRRRSSPIGTFVALALVVLVFGPVHAQRNQPIYPAYDGYVKNPDGSYTLSFAYFSHNAEVVTIAPGTANGFAPEPADRHQPTTFRPGHWRFQCVMVVGPEFDGRLRWTLAYAGTTTGTSERMLQSNWNLVEGAEELRTIDYASVPKGVCLNRAPTVRVLGVTARRDEPATLTTAVGDELNLFGSVHDEGLPRGRDVVSTWSQVRGPAQVTFATPDSARTRASFTAPGTYELELSATDSELTSRYRLRVVVK